MRVKGGAAHDEGKVTYDFGDTAGTTPLMKMLTLGRGSKNPPIHAGGLRYHAMSPIISYLIANGGMRSVAFGQREVFEAGVTFARTEGIIPAPESAHEIKFVIDEALRCKETGEAKTIVFNNSGHALLDLAACPMRVPGWKTRRLGTDEYRIPVFRKVAYGQMPRDFIASDDPGTAIARAASRIGTLCFVENSCTEAKPETIFLSSSLLTASSVQCCLERF